MRMSRDQIGRGGIWTSFSARNPRVSLLSNSLVPDQASHQCSSHASASVEIFNDEPSLPPNPLSRVLPIVPPLSVPSFHIPPPFRALPWSSLPYSSPFSVLFRALPWSSLSFRGLPFCDPPSFRGSVINIIYFIFTNDPSALITPLCQYGIPFWRLGSLC